MADLQQPVVCFHCGHSMGLGIEQRQTDPLNPRRRNGVLLLDHSVGTRGALLSDASKTILPEICQNCGANDRNKDRRGASSTPEETPVEEPARGVA